MGACCIEANKDIEDYDPYKDGPEKGVVPAKVDDSHVTKDEHQTEE